MKKFNVLLTHEDVKFFAHATIEQVGIDSWVCRADNPQIEAYATTEHEAYSQAQTKFRVIVDEAVRYKSIR